MVGLHRSEIDGYFGRYSKSLRCRFSPSCPRWFNFSMRKPGKGWYLWPQINTDVTRIVFVSHVMTAVVVRKLKAADGR